MWDISIIGFVHMWVGSIIGSIHEGKFIES
jgi:hypothetical protein